MAGLSDAPRPGRGALIGVDPAGPLASLVVFQYNPDTITRSVRARAVGADDPDAPDAEALRLDGAPIETLSMTVEVDAADQPGSVYGVHPQLAAIEMLLYPKARTVLANAALNALGTLELIPSEAPFTLLVWGARRVLPVRLSAFSITEEAFDADLDPTRATVSLELRVLSYNDLPPTHPGHHLFLAHQIVKEAMATAAGVSAIARAGAGTVESIVRAVH